MRKLKLDELGRDSVADFQDKQKLPLVVVLDNIRSAMNVGSFFRTGDAFLIEKILLCGITATPPNREITKTAIGATESVHWEYHENITSALEQLKSAGYQLVGIEQTDVSVLLDDFEIKDDGKYALVFGNEVDGVSDEALAHLDVCLEIPQDGTKHSLNVSVCGGIVLWEFYLALNK
ncbi:MAG TPA: RNA methyltransferase [Saprospiraceae bacterium]|nr:RNA methyltransferase [Saprospiraceae bacterium]